MTTEKIMADLLQQLIIVAELHSLEHSKNEAVVAQDYPLAIQINDQIKEKKKSLLTLEKLKEFHRIVSEISNSHPGE